MSDRFSSSILICLSVGMLPAYPEQAITYYFLFIKLWHPDNIFLLLLSSVINVLEYWHLYHTLTTRNTVQSQ